MMSRTKNTYDMYTAVRKHDVILHRVTKQSDDTLQSVLDSLNEITLHSSQRGYVATTSQIKLMKRNILAIRKLSATLSKLALYSDKASLLSKISYRYRLIATNLYRQYEMYVSTKNT